MELLRKTASGIMMMLLIGMLTLAFNIQPAKAWTPVEGHISQDTWWTVADSPYRLIGDVIVDAGVTLTIEPGVRVEITDGRSLIVNGSLYAVGTADALVEFTSSRTDPFAGAWKTVEFCGSENESFVVEFASFSFAEHGITVRGLGEARILNSVFRNCSRSGIRIVGQVNLLIKGNSFTAVEYGIFGEGQRISGVIIQQNDINSNNNGIYAYANSYYCGYVYNLTIQNNQITANGNGIYAYAKSYWRDGYVYNLTIQSNQITANGNGIYAYADADECSYVYNLTIQSNQITANGNGIYAYAKSYYYDAYVYNLTIQSNQITANGNGIYAYAYADECSYVYNLTIQNNKALSCNYGLVIQANRYSPKFACDALIINNILSGNTEAGIKIIKVKTKITNNSVAYNTYGIYYESSTGNVAHFNDIYRNSLYGMYISHSTVNAEHNYWGNETGPYHESVNPEGKGDQVNGDGTDLDFIPWLTSPVGTINERPVAVLTADKTEVYINETVTLDASQSYDDGKIVYFFFDFGDGTNSSWTTTSVVKHKYTREGVYNVTLIVMDDFGVKSLDSNQVYITITVVPEFPPTLILPLFIILSKLAILLARKRFPTKLKT